MPPCVALDAAHRDLRPRHLRRPRGDDLPPRCGSATATTARARRRAGRRDRSAVARATDALTGGDPAARFDGGPGADRIEGGPGLGLAGGFAFRSRREGVSIDLAPAARATATPSRHRACRRRRGPRPALGGAGATTCWTAASGDDMLVGGPAARTRRRPARRRAQDRLRGDPPRATSTCTPRTEIARCAARRPGDDATERRRNRSRLVGDDRSRRPGPPVRRGGSRLAHRQPRAPTRSSAAPGGGRSCAGGRGADRLGSADGAVAISSTAAAAGRDRSPRRRERSRSGLRKPAARVAILHRR